MKIESPIQFNTDIEKDNKTIGKKVRNYGIAIGGALAGHGLYRGFLELEKRMPGKWKLLGLPATGLSASVGTIAGMIAKKSGKFNKTQILQKSLKAAESIQPLTRTAFIGLGAALSKDIASQHLKKKKGPSGR